MSLVTDTHNAYRGAGLRLQKNLAKFNQSLSDADFQTGVGIFIQHFVSNPDRY